MHCCQYLSTVLSFPCTQDFNAVFNVNVNGIFNFVKEVLPQMEKQKYGRIVNIASIAGKEGNAGMLAYSGSKAAVIGLVKSAAKDYAETGITCNAIAPAVIRTAMVDALVRSFLALLFRPPPLTHVTFFRSLQHR